MDTIKSLGPGFGWRSNLFTEWSWSGWYVQELGPEDVSLLERCPHFRGWYVQASMELGPEDVSLLERCPHFRGRYIQASMELGPEDVSLLERCPHFSGRYIQASMELGPEDVSLLERYPHFSGPLQTLYSINSNTYTPPPAVSWQAHRLHGPETLPEL